MVKIIEEMRLENMTCLLVERFNLATIILMTDVTSEMLETVCVGDQFEMLVTDLEFWGHGSFTTSTSFCHQHDSVINNTVTLIFPC